MFKKPGAPLPPPTAARPASFASGGLPSLANAFKPQALTGVAYNPMTGASTVRAGRPSLLGGA